MSTTTVKILFASADWHVETSAEIEEPLDELLIAAGVGEITSGGVGPDGVFVVVDGDLVVASFGFPALMSWRDDAVTTQLLLPAQLDLAGSQLRFVEADSGRHRDCGEISRRQ